MSSSVDERIVKLGFDNGKFEKGVSQSMSTLDKLEEKLKFKHADEGAKNLQRAFSGFDFSVMSRGIESLERRFSTMGIAGMNVVNKITDSVIGAAKRIEAATIGQIKAGGWSRAMNLANAQFQIEGLGEDWNEMQKAISYGVKDTAYGLDAAASAASSLVASGVAYKESIDGANDSLMHTSLRAISGVAAMTNSSYEDISRIFTTVAGNGRLMGDQLLQLSSRGLNVAANLANAFGKTEAEIRDMVSHGQIDFETFATAMDDAFGAHAKEANKTFTGALSNMKAALSRFGAVFATPIIDKTNTLFISLTSRIDELKGKLMDVKDEEGNIKKIGLGTHFAEMWQSGIDAFSRLVEVIDLSWFDSVVKKVDSVTVKIKSFFDTLKEYLGESSQEAADQINDATKTMLVSAKEAQAAKDVIEKGLYGSGTARHSALTELFGDGEEGELHANNVQAYINAVIAAGYDYEKSAIKVAEVNEKVAQSEEELASQIKKAKIKAYFDKAKATLSNLWKVVTNIGKSAKKIGSAILTAFGNVFKIDFGGITDGVVSFSDALVKLSEKLIISDETGKKITKIFEFFFSVLKKGASILIGAGKNAKDFFKEFKTTNLFEKLSNGFETFSNKVTNSKVFKWISDKITGLLDTTNDFDFFSNIKDKFIEMSNTVDGDGFFSGVKESIAGVFSSIGEIKLPDSFSNNGFVQAITGFFGNISSLITGEESLPDKIKGFFSAVVEAIKSIDWDSVKKNAEAVLATLIVYRFLKILQSIQGLIDAVASVPGKLAKIFGGLASVLDAGSMSMKRLTTASIIKAIGTAVLDVAIALYALSTIPADDIYRVVSVITFLIGIMYLTAKGLKKLNPTIAEVSKEGLKLNLQAKNLVRINVGSIGFGLIAIALGSIIGGIAAVLKVVDSLHDPTEAFKTLRNIIAAASVLVVGIIAALVVATNKMSDVKSIGEKLATYLPLGAAVALLVGTLVTSILILTAALKVVSTIDPKVLDDSVYALIKIMGVLGLIIVAILGTIAVAKKNGGEIRTGPVLAVSVLIVAFSASIAILVGAITALSALLIAAGLSGQAEAAIVAVGVVAGLIVVLGIMISIMTNSLAKINGEKLKGVAVVFLAVAAVIAVIAISISKLATSAASVGKSILAVLSIVGVIVALTFAIKKIIEAFSAASFSRMDSDPKEMMFAIGLGFIMLAGAMLILAVAIEKIAGIQNGLAPAIISLGVFAAIIIGLAIASAKITGFGDAMIKVGTAFLFAGVGFALVGVGALLVAKGFSIMLEALQRFVPVMDEFFTVFEKHAPAAILFGIVVIATIAGLVVLVIKLSSLLQPLVELITTALKAVINAFGGFAKKTGSGLSDFTSKLSKKTKSAIVAIIGGMLVAIASMTPEMLDTIGMIIIKVLSWLGSIVGDVAEGLVNFLINLINGVADAIRLNSARIANAFWSLIYALISIILNIFREVVDKNPLLGWMSGLLEDADMALNEMAADRRKTAEELDKQKKINNNYLLGIEEDTSRTDKATKMSLGSIFKSFLGMGAGSEVSAEAVEDSMSRITKATGQSAEEVVDNINTEREALVQLKATAFYDPLANAGTSAGLDAAKRAVASQSKYKKHYEELGEKTGKTTGSAFTTGMSDEIIAGFGGHWDDVSVDMNDYAWDLGNTGGETTTTAATAALDNPQAYGDAMNDNMSAITTSIDEHQEQVQTSTKTSINDTITTTISESRGDVESASKYALRGWLDGVEKEKPVMLKSMADMVAELKKVVTGPDGLDEHSPSKVAYGWGKYLVMGLADGVRNSTLLATDSAAELSDAMIVSFGAPLDYLAKIASGELVYDPSIRPVIDSSAIRSGAGTINRMIGAQQIQLSGYSGQLAADISQLDNSNLRVVEELQQLRADMADMTEQITNMQMVMDTGALVGQISGPIDRSLGRSMIRKGRGN